MTRRRTLSLVAIAAVGVGAFVVVRRRAAVPTTAPPEAPETPVVPATPAAVPPPAWVATAGGDAPDGYPVKVNTRSGIFHVPGGRSYDRTVPDRCYATAADAEADGYRRAKA